MEDRVNFGKQKIIIQGKWLLMTALIGVLSGTLSAIFLKSLEIVTDIRVSHSWFVLFLPFSGMLTVYLYRKYGKNASRGNNLIIEQANGGNERIPLQLVPLVLFGTLTTHLFGGSVGREGTAVQMGGAVADLVTRLFKITDKERYLLIICGISGGFSSVFGTPLAGTLFALEVLSLGRLNKKALLPAFITAVVANLVTLGLGVSHSHYQIGVIPLTTVKLIALLTFFGLIFGVVSRLFSRSIVFIKQFYAKMISNSILRIGVGGVVVLLLLFCYQTTRYAGLSLPLLSEAFKGTQAPFDFIHKFIFTVFSLGAGFQGGEVTPLFEIGATLGSTLASVTGLPVAFVAALGFISVFAGATNTPIASFVMGVELFGSEAAGWLLFTCLLSCSVSGKNGIYSAQLTKGNDGGD